VLEIEKTSGGIFDQSTAEPGQVPDGTITLEFEDCTSGKVIYDITSINRQGTIPMTRIANDNVALCEAIVAGTQ